MNDDDYDYDEMCVGIASLEFQPQISVAGKFVANSVLAVGSGFAALVYTYVAVSLLVDC